MSFGISLDRLEKIVDRLENNNLDLDESMKLLEEGLKIHNDLKNKLEKSKKNIEKIIGNEEVD